MLSDRPGVLSDCESSPALSDDDEGSVGNEENDSETAASLLISEELLKREREYIRLNKELQSKTLKVVKDVEDRVKKGRETLVRPMTAPGPSRAAEAAEEDAPETETETHAKQQNARTKVATKSRPSTAIRTTQKRKPVKDVMSTPRQEVDTRTLLSTLQIPSDLPEQALVSLLAHKLHAAQGTISSLTTTAQQKTAEIQTLEDASRQLHSRISELSKALESSKKECDKHAKKEDEFRSKHEEGLELNKTLSKEIESVKKRLRETEDDLRKLDIKYKRVVDECDRLKREKSKGASEGKDKERNLKETNEKLLADLRRLQKQKQDILAAFRKQAQLVDVLKRQKMHLEAAKVLEFSEEEFMRILHLDI
ncbi:hypothetical protein BC832DRAFT_274196 [Gaertneriomyces semiglobifer]|nr:hypothetical protein BC832DRAFT_274196 [Gaertneriomyces semiglobifer]